MSGSGHRVLHFITGKGREGGEGLWKSHQKIKQFMLIYNMALWCTFWE